MELLIEEEKYTVKDFRTMGNLDENYYYELIDGEIVQKSSPNIEHQRALRKFVVKLDRYVTDKK
jgi:hypothetical protein